MIDWQKDVEDFHRKFGLTIGGRPTIPDAKTVADRICFIGEEWTELQFAMKHASLADIADGLADVMYTVLGAAIEFGIDLDPVWRAVHEANMKKERSPDIESTKLTKPMGWQHPIGPIYRALEKQRQGE